MLVLKGFVVFFISVLLPEVIDVFFMAVREIYTNSVYCMKQFFYFYTSLEKLLFETVGRILKSIRRQLL